jgi:hypothetical protein
MKLYLQVTTGGDILKVSYQEHVNIIIILDKFTKKMLTISRKKLEAPDINLPQNNILPFGVAVE